MGAVAKEGALFLGWFPTLVGYSLQGLCKFGFYEIFKVCWAMCRLLSHANLTNVSFVRRATILVS